MNIWDILGIEKTKDKDSIKDAYRKKLVLVNPEEDQQGFMELRSAYEQAVIEADKAETNAENEEPLEEEFPDTPVGLWMRKADNLYQNIELRGNKEKWEELLEEDICFSLETKTEVRDELLYYFMSHYYLPQKIWKVLDEKFLLREYEEELYELFPANYVEQGIIGNIENKEFIDIQYIQSQGGNDYDGFLEKCYELYHLLAAGNIEEAEPKFEEIKVFQIYHPYVDIFRIRYLISQDEMSEMEKEEVEKLSHNLMEKMPENEEVLRAAGEICCVKGEFDKAKELYEKILTIASNPYNAMVALGNICFQQKEYIQAKKYYDDAYDIHKSDYVGQIILSCIEEIEKIYKQRWEENPENLENAIELARTYYQQSKFEESMDFLLQISPDKDNHLEYVHLLGCNYMYVGKHENALPYLKQWVEETLKLVDDGTEKTKKAIKRLSAAYHCTAQALVGLGRYEEAEEYFDKALETGIHIIDVYEEKARIYYNNRKYEEVIEACEKIFEYDNQSPIGHGLRGEAFYSLGYYMDSKEEWDYCIGISPNNLAFYIKKVDCLYLMGEYEEALRVLDYVKEHGAESDSITMWEAILLRTEEKEDEALKCLLDLSVKAETVKDFEQAIVDRIYFEIARIYTNKDLTDEAEFYVDKALKVNPHFIKAIIYKAHMHWQKNQFEEAIACFSKVLEENPNYIHVKANGKIGEIYEEQGDFEKALEYYTKQLKIGPDPFYYLSRGWCYERLRKPEEAKANYEKSLELEPTNGNTCCLLANIYKWEGEDEKAAELFEEGYKRSAENFQAWQYRSYVKVLRRLKQWDKAISMLNECIEKIKDPDDRKKLATIYMTLGHYRAAMEQYIELANMGDENRLNIAGEMINCLLLMNKMDEAKAMIQRQFMHCSLSVNKEALEYDAYLKQVYWYLMNNKISRAKREYKTWMRHFASSDVAGMKDFVFLRCHFVLQDEKEKNKQIFHKSIAPIIEKLEEQAKDIDVYASEAHKYNYLAIIELAKDNYDKSMEYVQKALESRKCDTCGNCVCVDAIYVKSIVFELTGRLEEALECYKTIMEIGADDLDYCISYKRIKEKMRKR